MMLVAVPPPSLVIIFVTSFYLFSMTFLQTLRIG